MKSNKRNEIIKKYLNTNNIIIAIMIILIVIAYTRIYYKRKATNRLIENENIDIIYDYINTEATYNVDTHANTNTNTNSEWINTSGGEVSLENCEYDKSDVVATRTLENYQLVITKDKRMIIMFSNGEEEKSVGVLKLNMPGDFAEKEEVNKWYYADYNNSNKECLRIRIDIVDSKTGVRAGCLWYYFDDQGKQISLEAYQEK